MCKGNELRLSDCKKVNHSLEEGRTIYGEAKIAGVTCLPAPSQPDIVCTNRTILPVGQSECTVGNVSIINGILQYCYNGNWSVFCSLTHREAIVACRQLGHTKNTCKYSLQLY